MRGGTDGNTAAKQKGSAMIIHSCPQGDPMFLETPSLANEFFEQLNASTAPNLCIMLPGDMQYWLPCTMYYSSGNVKSVGSKNFMIHEPVHFCGPDPNAPIPEEEKKIDPESTPLAIVEASIETDAGPARQVLMIDPARLMSFKPKTFEDSI